MKALKYGSLVLAALIAVVIVLAPIGPLPGFFIGGTPTPVPDQWPDTSEVDEILLKVPGIPPRVVTLWVVDHQGDLHVVGASDSVWVRRLKNGGPVALRLGDATYALKAVPVTDDWEAVLRAYVAKYQEDYPDIVAGFPPIEEAAGQVAVFRLERG